MSQPQLPEGLRGVKNVWGMAASLMLIGILAGLLLSCASAKHPAAASVEAYLQALVEKNEPRLTSLTCESFESDALLELDAFGMVKTRLDGLDCQAQDPGQNTAKQDTATVICQGKIVATYGAEDQVFDLSERVYQVQKQGDDWLVCGR